jgi:hypothetical protein
VPLKRKTEPDHRPDLPLFALRVFAKCPTIREMVGRAVGIEFASLLHKHLYGNDLVPLLLFQLLLIVVREPFGQFGLCQPQRHVAGGATAHPILTFQHPNRV